jgi:hypothetical protein
VFIVTIAISLVSSADLVSMLFSIMMLIGFLCFYYPLVLVFLRQYGEGKDLAYICSFVQFNSLLKKFKICFYAIIRAAKDRYYNSTRKEIIFLITIKFVIFALIISLGFCFTKNNLNIVFFFLRFLACFIFLFVLPLYSKYEKNLIYYIENYNVEDLIYKSVYKFILSISIGIAFVIVMYLVTTIFHWEIFLLEHIIYM